MQFERDKSARIAINSNSTTILRRILHKDNGMKAYEMRIGWYFFPKKR